MFALKFDDLQRKMLAQEKPVLLKPLLSAMPGTQDYDAYMGLFLMPENTNIHIQLEDDLKTATFYVIIEDEKSIKREQEAKYERIRQAELARRTGGSDGAFV